MFEEESSDVRQPRRPHDRTYDNSGLNADVPMFEAIENLEDTKGMEVADWVQKPATRHEIKNRFLSFLRTFFNDDGRSVYADKITAMAQDNRRSLLVDYEQLADSEMVLAYFLLEAPREMLEILDEVAYEVTLSRYPRYHEVSEVIHVRLIQLPLVEDIRSLRMTHMNQLIRTRGTISACTPVMPQLSMVQYNCVRCSCKIGPFLHTDDNDMTPAQCPDCQSRGPFKINSEKVG